MLGTDHSVVGTDPDLFYTMGHQTVSAPTPPHFRTLSIFTKAGGRNGYWMGLWGRPLGQILS